MNIPKRDEQTKSKPRFLALAMGLAASASLLAGTARAGTPITWNVAADGAWDTTTANWTTDGGATTTAFTSDGSEDAIFAAGTAGHTITISSAMSPASTTVSGGTYTFSGGPLAGSGSLTKSGSGTLKIDDLVSGTGTVVSNTYSGGTIMNNGTLHLGGMYNGISPACQGALGTGPVTLNGGTVEFDRYTATNALTVNGGTLYSPNGWGATWSGPITLNATLTCNAGYNLTFSGAVSGAGGLNKTGGNTLILSGSNSYTGPTTVTSGTLECDTANSPGSGTLSISTGAKVNLKYTGTKAIASLSLGGVAQTVFGTYGSSTSGAAVQNDTYFTGSGTVTVSPIITSFGIPGYAGVINQVAKTIAVTVPFGTSLATLAPTFTVTFGSCNQTSGSPPSPTFAAGNPAHYIVSSGGFQNDYAVTVTVAAVSTACDILTFGLPDNAGIIDPIAKTITLNVPVSPGVTSLAPTYTVSQFATGSPPSGTSRDFTNPLTYTVTAQDGTTKKTYTVTAQTYQSWSHSGSIFILTTPDGANIPAGASETNFPLLVRFNSSNFNFAQAASDGSDIRFSTTAGTALSYEIEQWDSINGQAAVWVKIPTITGNARQEIKVYWGKPGVASQSNGPAVFNSTNGYCCVMHLNGNVLDSTGSTSPVNGGATATTAVIGSTAMNLLSGDITAANITNFPTGSNPTSSGEVWIRARQINSGWCMPLAWGNQNAYGWNTWIMQIGFWGSPTVLPAPITCRGPAVVSGSTALAAQQWYHVVYTASNGTGNLYVNGVLDATASGGSISITNPQAMSLAAAGGDADVDEARISSVVRSAAWVKMEYENQKPLQTLAGNVVQAGSTFSATPPSVTLNEGTTTTLSGQAGGAQKVYWSLVRNGVETVLATDQFTYTVSAGRVTGNQSFVIRFKGIYPTGNQSVDIPVTVTDTIPDPVFTLSASTSLWDGRQTMTVTPVISNLAALQAAGVANLNSTWSVAGVAVAKTITGGSSTVPGVLTLTRSQGSGPMTVTLVLDNGGALVSNSATTTVQEPASDAWVQRTPGATEKALNNQFIARNPNTNLGTIYYNGTQSGSPSSVYLKVYKTPENGTETLDNTYRQALVAGTYAFTAPITAGRVTYRAVYGTTTGGVDSDVASVTNLVCGDAYILQGQSNAVATDSLPGDATNSTWIRTYGQTSGTWGNAVRNGSDFWIGYWAYDMAVTLSNTYNMPICIVNGAVGGTRIDQHQANPADHTVAGSLYSIYANLLNRVIGAKLTYGIRGVFWHQGENNSGAAAPTGDYDYKSYQQYFVDMSAAWKQDYPNLQRYIVFQVQPKPCSMGPKGDQLRNVQRTLSRLYSKMSTLSTIGIDTTAGYLGCHYSAVGYQAIADLTSPLVGRDFYGVVPAAAVTAPNLQRAYFTNSSRNQIALEFDQPMAWNSFSTVNFYLDKVSGKVTSGSASGNVVTLQLSAASTNSTIDYVEDSYWSGSAANLLYGTNGIAALTFADVPLSPAALAQALSTPEDTPLPVTLSGTSVSGTTLTYAVVGQPAHGTLSGTAPNLTYTPAANYTGPDSFTFKANDGTLNSAPATVSITVSGSAFSAWAGNPAQGLTAGVNDGALDDPDKDGIPNLLEFVLGGAPMTASRTILPALNKSGATWVFEYDRNDLSLPPATVQVVEYGSDLTGWTPVTIPATSAGPAVTITPGTSSDHVSVVIPALGTREFVRLKVSQ